jgi:hypothetical protein
MNIEIRPARKKPKNILSGAIDIAIEKAERYGTPLVVKRNGKVEEITPREMKRRLRV